MTKKLYIRTFGCQMNEYDSAKMVDVLAQSQAGGIETTDDPQQADIVLFKPRKRCSPTSVACACSSSSDPIS